MLRTVRKIIGGDNDVKSVVQKYNKDLSSITNKIHDYEASLKGVDTKRKRVSSAVTYYYLTILTVVVAYVYVKSSTAAAVLSVIIGLLVLIGIRLVIKRVYQMLSNKYESRIAALRSLHQEKMEELKQKTNFYYTNSLIQRFSSGESGSDDLVLLIDDEVKSKQEQLEKLKAELDRLREDEQLKSQSEDVEAREKWFDKALGLLAGGDDVKNLQSSISLIVCPQCKESRGCYSAVGVPFTYICTNCGYKQDNSTNNSKEPQETDSLTTTETSTN